MLGQRELLSHNSTFLSMALKNICSEGYTHVSSSLLPALGIVERSLLVERGNGWPGAGSWLRLGICESKAVVTESFACSISGYTDQIVGIEVLSTNWAAALSHLIELSEWYQSYGSSRIHYRNT